MTAIRTENLGFLSSLTTERSYQMDTTRSWVFSVYCMNTFWGGLLISVDFWNSTIFYLTPNFIFVVRKLGKCSFSAFETLFESSVTKVLKSTGTQFFRPITHHLLHKTVFSPTIENYCFRNHIFCFFKFLFSRHKQFTAFTRKDFPCILWDLFPPTVSCKM